MCFYVYFINIFINFHLKNNLYTLYMSERVQIVKLDYLHDIIQYMNNLIMYNQQKLKSLDYIYYSPSKEYDKIKIKYDKHILNEFIYIDHNSFKYYVYYVPLDIWSNILDDIHLLNDNRDDIPEEIKYDITGFINSYKNIYDKKYVQYDKKI